ncbi:MAG: TolC family protein [Bacteroidetes bacterium]|nr:TolC family protein [Bacteroidota bacterium]
MKIQLFLITGFLCFQPNTSLRAQNALGLRETIQVALENNYEIKLIKDWSAILKEQATKGNAGMLPSVFLNAGANKSSNNINQVFSTGLEVNKNGVGSGNLNAGLALNWTIFDGMKMFTTYKKLIEISTQGELQVKQQMENSVMDIITNFYNLSRLTQKKTAIENTLAIYRERLSIAETRLEIGSGSKADILQAKLELNEQLAAELQQNFAIQNLKSELNRQLGGTQTYDFIVDTSPAGTIQDRAFYESKLLNDNSAVKIAESKWIQNNYQIKEAISLSYPKLNLVANYNWNRTNSEAGFALLNQSLGYTYGLTLSWNLFNGSVIKSNIQVAKINSHYYEIGIYSEKKRVQEAFNQAYQALTLSYAQLKLEEESVNIAKEYMQIILERFKLGKSTSLELKDAQNGYLQAQLRFADASYDQKIAESQLKKLNGTLL